MTVGEKNKVVFVLGIDGGGTKTLARLTNLQTQQTWHSQGGGSSLTNNLSGAISTLTDLCQQLVKQAQCSPKQISAVFGLAGAGNEASVQQLKDALAMPFVQLTVCSDARTSAYGANKGQPVAVVALGTGAVGMRLSENGHTQLMGGWGFQVGDEGGGAKLGLAAVKATIAELEQNDCCTSLLTQTIARVIGQTRPELLTWLSGVTPADYAVFSPTIFKLAANCQVAKLLIDQHIIAVEALIKLTLDNTQLPLVLLGGLAQPTQPYLAKSIQQQLLTPKGSALDGACFLAASFYRLK